MWHTSKKETHLFQFKYDDSPLLVDGVWPCHVGELPDLHVNTISVQFGSKTFRNYNNIKQNGELIIHMEDVLRSIIKKGALRYAFLV